MPKTFSFIIGAKGIKPAFTSNAQRKSEVNQDSQKLDDSLDNVKNLMQI